MFVFLLRGVCVLHQGASNSFFIMSGDTGEIVDTFGLISKLVILVIMIFSSQYQNFDQYKDQLKKRFNVSDITNDTPNEPQDSKKHFEKAKGEFDIFSNSISNELAGSVQSAFLYETTVAARITVNKYLNRRMRNDLKYCLDAWRSKVLRVSKTPSLRSNTSAQERVTREEAKSDPRPKLDLNVVYSSLENVYQKMSMDVYTRILSQGTEVFETLKIPEDILQYTLNIRSFYLNEMKSKDAENYFANENDVPQA